MRQTIGGTWVLGLMLMFIFLFSGYIILTLNYSKTVKTKNELISIFEKYEGLNDNSVKLANNYLSSNNYTATGVCSTKSSAPGMYGTDDLGSVKLEEVQPGKKYRYCVKKYKGTNTSTYYQVVVFYQFNIPILRMINDFTVRGTTSNFQARDNPEYARSVDGSYVTHSLISSVSGSGSSSNPGSPSRPTTSGSGSASPKTYTVNFNLNGGDGQAPITQTLNAGAKASKLVDPSRAGYTFGGWTLNGSDYNFGNSVNSNLTLVAKWNKEEIVSGVQAFAVNFDLGGGSCNECSTQTVNNGSIATKPINITKGRRLLTTQEYKFLGWYYNDREFDFSTPITSSITLTAKWQQNTLYRVEYRNFDIYSFDDVDVNIDDSSKTVTYTPRVHHGESFQFYLEEGKNPNAEDLVHELGRIIDISFQERNYAPIKYYREKGYTVKVNRLGVDYTHIEERGRRETTSNGRVVDVVLNGGK